MAIEKKRLNCIVCPMGCEINIELTDGKITKIEGNTCKRGEMYSKEELTAPRRMLTSSVRIKNGMLPLLPVVSSSAIPKDRILDCAEALRGIVAEAPVRAGAVIMPNILGLGVDMVASRDMER